MKKILIKGRGAIPGKADGEALVAKESFQGDSAINFETGEIIQKGHPLEGNNISGSILVLAGGRGSTGWSCRLHAAAVNGVGPAAMIFPKMDSRTAGASAVLNVPVVTDLDKDPFTEISTGDNVKIDGEQGTIEVIKKHVNYSHTN